MQTPMNPANRRTPRRRGRPTLAGAVFGALVTFLVLLGATVVSDTPRPFPDINGTLAAAEMFDGSPLHAVQSADPLQVHTPVARRHDDPGLALNDAMPV